MGLLDIFKNKENGLHRLDLALRASFDRIRNDTSLVYSWIHYFREKDKVYDDQHHFTMQQINNNSQSIQGIQHQIIELKAEIVRLSLDRGQVGTRERTSKGQLKDMSPRREMAKIAHAGFFNKEKLRGSELELLELLYHADRPLGYGEIGKRLSKTEKSIRNLIYEMRRKNVEILDTPIGVREKGFYLSGPMKLAVSGR